ncbi:MAG: segregation and condensation protein A, partial [Acidimicrobiales bacterium]
MPYEVRTAVFEGPLDLLLHLITAQQVDLWEVSISTIVDAYLEEMEKLEDLDLETATELALVAATLIQLKCRRLLPGPEDVDLDEDLALWEERDLLLARLLECKTFKDAALALSELAAEADRSLPRVAGMEEPFSALAPDLLAGLTPGDLRAAMRRAAAPAPPPPRVDVSHLPPVTLTVAEAAAALVGTLARAGTATFRQLTSQAGNRLEVIVAFLAVLELYKQGLVEIEQAGTFGELGVVWTGDEAQAALVAQGGVGE